MTVGSSQGIGSIHELAHVVVRNLQKTLQHACHLFLRGRAIACKCHFDFHRGILVNGDTMAYGCSNGYALSSAQLQHRLHILAEEGCLDGHFVGQKGVDDTRDTLEDMTQLQITVIELSKVYDPHDNHLGLAIDHAQHTVAHNIGSRVNTQYNFFFHNLS